MRSRANVLAFLLTNCNCTRAASCVYVKGVCLHCARRRYARHGKHSGTAGMLPTNCSESDINEPVPGLARGRGSKRAHGPNGAPMRLLPQCSAGDQHGRSHIPKCSRVDTELHWGGRQRADTNLVRTNSKPRTATTSRPQHVTEGNGHCCAQGKEVLRGGGKVQQVRTITYQKYRKYRAAPNRELLF